MGRKGRISMKSGMNIRQCYTVLELPICSPLDEVKLSYKDLVQVWHPDRFAHSPRLQEKAAGKLQQLNEAYDTLKNHLERQAKQGVYGYGTASPAAADSGAYGSASQGAAGYGSARGNQDWTTGSQATATAAGSRPGSRAASRSAMPSFFDSGSSYSWQWQLQATALIFGFMGVLLLPIGLAVLISEHPLMILLLMPLPVAAYVYRAWVTR